ncbi:MAG TPA: hypothetical protein VGV38_03475, partial [Pyrinomonadaceae bacterium]|nr:hypothetical protein [Pyrinomonadaceae bacterium]
ADPTRWLCVVETDKAFVRFHVTLADDAPPRDLQRFEKPSGELAEVAPRAVGRDYAAFVFFDFARFPAAQLSRNCADRTLLQFADLRFAVPGERRGSFTLDLPAEPTEATP